MGKAREKIQISTHPNVLSCKSTCPLNNGLSEISQQFCRIYIKTVYMYNVQCTYTVLNSREFSFYVLGRYISEVNVTYAWLWNVVSDVF